MWTWIFYWRRSLHITFNVTTFLNTHTRHCYECCERNSSTVTSKLLSGVLVSFHLIPTTTIVTGTLKRDGGATRHCICKISRLMHTYSSNLKPPTTITTYTLKYYQLPTVWGPERQGRVQATSSLTRYRADDNSMSTTKSYFHILSYNQKQRQRPCSTTTRVLCCHPEPSFALS